MKGALPAFGAAGAPVRRQGRRKLWLGAGLAILALAGLGLGLWLSLSVEHAVKAVYGWISGLGLWGLLAFAVLYVLGALALAPGSVMTILGGLAFGAWAVPVVLVCGTGAAALAFLIARYLARDQVARLLERHPKFRAVDRAVDEEGWKIVALLRLSPLIPFGLQNYALGLTSVGFPAYVAATFFGIMPGTVLYVTLGAIGRAAGSGEALGALRAAFFALGLLATIAVTVIVARRARAKLQETGLAAPSKR